MAGLYVKLRPSRVDWQDGVSRFLRFKDEAERRYSDLISYVWLSHDDPELFAPAIDPVSGVHVVVAGRLSLTNAEWAVARRLPFEGGVANRIVLNRYLSHGAKGVTPFNGAALVFIWDPRERICHSFTDQFGYHPAFIAGSDASRPEVLTTFPDALGADSDFVLRPDLVSMAEFLRAWRTTPPNTYYKDVCHAGAATHWILPLDGDCRATSYWEPFREEFFPTINDAADELASVLKTVIRERTAIAKKPAFFMSGGADSRVLLYAMTDPSRVRGINLYERPMHEAKITRQLCERVGAEYVPFQRDSDYYPRMQHDNVRWSGAMWCTEDAHYLGVRDAVDLSDADVVMSACTTDWLFKGYGLEKTYRKFIGRNLPLMRFVGERQDGFLPNCPSAPPLEFANEINSRMSAWFAGVPSVLSSDLDHLVSEDRRVRPTCYAVSVSGQIMYRTYPYDTFLADSRVAGCYSRIKAEWKLNGNVWGLAAGKVCAKAQDIVDSNYGWSLSAGTGSKLLTFAKGWLKRRIIKKEFVPAPEDGRPPSNASWPDMGWYAKHSTRLQEFWHDTPESHRELMGRLWGADPWGRPLDEWALKGAELTRTLTLLEHWRQRDGFI